MSGIFGKLSSMFQPKQENNKGIISSPLKGKVIPLSEVPDEVFASKMLGDGFAIIPEEGVLVSPVDGEIVTVFHTKHAIGIKASNGYEMLIHVGIDTVKLNGEGFTVKVKEGDRVSRGTVLLDINLPYIEEHAKSTITPILFTNWKEGDTLQIVKNEVERGTDDFILIIKG